MELKPIGKIHSPFSSKEKCPIQPLYAADSEGQVELFEPFDQGLKDLSGFSHIYLIYRFDRAGEIRMVRPTFLDDTPHDIYASRHPCRPNGIGISIVRLLKQDGRFLSVSGVDMLDDTPLLDIKPYLPRFDAFPSASEGWIAATAFRKKPPGRE